MALVFRSYLGLSSKWAIAGDVKRKMDYQIWCGPAMGAFNQWVKGSFLENHENRKAAEIALNLIFGACISLRVSILKLQNIDISLETAQFKPIPAQGILKYL